MKKYIYLFVLLFAVELTEAQVTIDNTTGNVGVKTTTPQHALDVNGTVKANNVLTPLINNQYIGHGLLGTTSSLAVGYDVLSPSLQNSSGSNIAVGSVVLKSLTTGGSNVGLGNFTLFSNTSGHSNVAVGVSAMGYNVNGSANVAIGTQALWHSTTTNQSTVIGNNAFPEATGNGNTGLGAYSGGSLTIGHGNTFVGLIAGAGITTGSNNTILGGSSQYSNTGITTGSGNTIVGGNFYGMLPNLTNHVVIGDGEGHQRIVVDENGNTGIGTTNPLNKFDVDITTNTEQKRVSVFTNTGNNTVNAPIGGIRFNWYGSNNAEIQMVRGYSGSDGAGLSFHTSGDGGVATERMRVDKYGNVGIGTTDPQAKLAVNGLIRSKEVKVETANFPDYVFKSTYRLPSLAEVKAYIDKNHHLPDMPSEKEVVKEGMDLGEMNKVLVKKVEELTLYLIELKRENSLIKEEQSRISKELKRVKNHHESN